jgi:predicted nucleic acid-binding protein
MRAVFVDTSAWDALEDSSDSHHAAAMRCRAALRQERMPLYVTNYVLDECYTLLLQNVGYTRTVAFKRTIDRMQAGDILVVVHVSDEIERAAWEVFERFNQDKLWSFTDCTTKVVMESVGIQQIFAFDHHFDQMGFVRLPTHTL